MTLAQSTIALYAGNRRRLYTTRATHVCRCRQVLSTADRPLSLFISHSLDGDGRRAVVKFSKTRVGDKFPGEVPLLLEIPENAA